jgi:hypothetical protein
VSNPCYVEFSIQDDDRLQAVTAVVDELQRDKEAGALEPGPKWRALFGERALAHFWWPTAAELDAWLRRWEATPVEERSTDPALKTPWGFDSLIDAFANGDYRLLGIRRSGDRARLEFDPNGFPYGGVDCMQALVEAFDFRVTEIDDGAQPPYKP